MSGIAPVTDKAFSFHLEFAHSVTLLFHRLIIKSKPSLDAVNISLDHDSVLYKMQSGSEQPIVYAKFVFIDRLPLIRPLWTLTRVFSMCASDPQNGHGFNSLLIPSPLYFVAHKRLIDRITKSLHKRFIL